MGGNAFKNLAIARIPHSHYPTCVTTILARLQPFYSTLLVPPSAPEKPSHGDIDIIVAGRQRPFGADELAGALCAASHITTKGSPTTAFAAWIEPPIQSYVQVDVHECETRAAAEWVAFFHSYGDLWNILGALGRHFGIFVNHHGCWCIVAATDEKKKASAKRYKVLLTADPREVLDVYGLDAERFEAGFGTLDEMFRFVCTSRFMRKVVFTKEVKSSDRTKRRKREVYAKWVDEFVPSLPDEETTLTRDAVREELLNRFWKQDEYNAVAEEIATLVRNREAWAKVIDERKATLNPTDVGLTVRFLKKKWEAKHKTYNGTIEAFTKENWRRAWNTSLEERDRLRQIQRNKSKENLKRKRAEVD